MKGWVVDFFVKNRTALMALGMQVVRGIMRLFRGIAQPGFRMGDKVVVLSGAEEEKARLARGDLGTVSGTMEGTVGVTLGSGKQISVKPENLRRIIGG